jgi:hypothetical protein
LLNFTGGQVLAWFVCAFLVMVFFFAAIYWLFLDIGLGNPIVAGPESFWDYVHFSFTTQTTLGYGDYLPRSFWARQIVAIQVTAVLALNAVGAGVVAARLVRRRAKIEFAPELAYDHRRHELRLVIWNRHMDDLCNAECKIIVRKTMRAEDYPAPVRRSFEVELRKNVPAYISSGAVVLAATSSDGGQARLCATMNPYQVSPVSILSLDPECKIFAVLTGNSVTSGGTIVASHEYKTKNVKCGLYKRYDPEAGRKDPYAKYRHFGKVDPTELRDCQKCDIKQHCYIRQERFVAATREAGQAPQPSAT